MTRRSLRAVAAWSLVVAVGVLLPTAALAFNDFADVDTAAFYHDDVHWLKENGITLGCGGGNYCPNDPVTRGQMAAFLHRATNVRESPGFAVTTVDSSGDVGTFTSLTLGVDGRGLMSYYDVTNGDLKVLHCSNLACTVATSTVIDSTDDVGQYTSITTGADGVGLISYYDSANGDLKVAHCANVACSAATLTTLDGGGVSDVGSYTSITVGADGVGLISYYDATNGDLKVAHCSNLACTAAISATLDSVGFVGSDGSITIGADGMGLISYLDFTNGDLKVAHCSNATCGSATLATLDSTGSVGDFSSITIGADGLGLISYYDSTNGDLKVAHCSDAMCSSAAVAALDVSGFVGQFTSITLGTEGLALLSYWDLSNSDLKVAHCTNVTCSAATLVTLDSAALNDVGQYTSITIGADGLGLISYYDATNGDLKVAHCSNAICVPYHRGR